MSAPSSFSYPGSRRHIPADAQERRWIAPDGFAIRRMDRPAPTGGMRGSMLFMPGRGDVYEKWLEALEQWHRDSWQITTADWRGQGFSGRFGGDALTGHIDDFAIWVDDYAALWSEWSQTTPGPHVAVAHSMGGHIVLRAIAEGRVRPDALVLSAPMLGIHPVWLPSRILHVAARIIATLRDRKRPAWKGDEKPQLVKNVRSQLLTHDLSRYEDEEWWRVQRPAIQMGAASWGWIERALDSMARLERRGALESVDIPVLLLATRVDGLVSWPAIRRAARRLPHAKLIAFGRECRHEILREADGVRDRAMLEIRDFLDRFAAPREGGDD